MVNIHDYFNQSEIPRLRALAAPRVCFVDSMFTFGSTAAADLIRRYDPQRGEWPYGTIERLYSHFRSSEVTEEWDDSFSGDDDDFELSP